MPRLPSRLVVLACLFWFFLPLTPFSPVHLASPALATPGTTSVVLMVGDGMGPEQVEFGRLVEYGPEGNSSLRGFPYTNEVATDNINEFTTDSAAAGTALATGVKTVNGRISMDWDANQELTTVLEIAETAGYTSGLVVTCHLTHATPAAFAAHDASRNNYHAIAEDMAGAGVDVLLGGGAGDSYLGLQVPRLQSAGYTLVTNKTALAGVSPTPAALPLLGLFAGGSLPREDERNATVVPALSEMVSRALALLEAAGNPYFLLVEGSQIDWAGHDNDPVYLAHEVIEFEKAVAVARAHALAQGDVQLLVVADHETGGLRINEYSFTTSLPAAGDDLATLRAKRIARAGEIDVSWSTGGHTSREVPLVGLGPHADQVAGARHLADVFGIMRGVIDGTTTPEGSGYYRGHVNAGWYIALGVGATVVGIVVLIRFVRRRRRPENGGTPPALTPGSPA